MGPALRAWLSRKGHALRWRAQEAVRIPAARGVSRLDAQLGRVAARTALVFDEPPTAVDVVERYASGWVLFGLQGGRYEWRSFDQRAVITPETATVPKRTRRELRKLAFDVRAVEDPGAIIDACRTNRSGWLTVETAAIYRKVDELGFLSAFGAYRDDELVGGMWGLALGSTFGGMSTFHTVDYAGAALLATFSDAVRDGELSMFDCGAINDHFRRYGAHEIPTAEFRQIVWRGLASVQHP
jgi:leucyl/phenylalanyl-tRNA---protein transferase